MKKFMQLHPFYEQDNGAGAGGAGGGEPTPGAEGGKPEDNKPAGGQEPEKLTMTQTELDELIEKRLGRERKKLEKYADYDEVKAAADELKRLKEEKRLAELDDVEKATEIAKLHEGEKEALRKELEALQGKVKANAIVAAFTKAATAANVEYIDDAYALADLSGVEVTDEGVTGVEDAVKKLVESKPFLLKAKAEQKPIGGASNGKQQQSDKPAADMLAEAAAKAKASGRMEDKLAYVALKAKLSE